MEERGKLERREVAKSKQARKEGREGGREEKRKEGKMSVQR